MNKLFNRVSFVIDEETTINTVIYVGNYMIGLRFLLIMVLISWAVNCRLPSPTKRITRLSAPSGSSLAASAAPRVAPTEYPILPQRT
jgi:hypothetical protein